MSNEEIIYKNSELLVLQGILKTVNVGGETIPEPIHTFQKWKELGFQVKKGEKSKIKFPIWKYTSKKVEVEGKEEEASNMFMKTAAFFTAEQVEKIN